MNVNTVVPELKRHTVSSTPWSPLAKLTGENVSLFTQILSDKKGQVDELVQNQYQLVDGAWPSEPTDIVLMLNAQGEIPAAVLYGLGALPLAEYEEAMTTLNRGDLIQPKTLHVDYSELVGKTFQLVIESDKYLKNDAGEFVYYGNDMTKLQQVIESYSTEVTICGIVQSTSESPMYSQAIGYTTAFTNYLYTCLLLNHPELENFQHIADEINEKYYMDYPEFAIRFRPRYTWSEDGTTVTKIGIRATNSYCNKSKEERSKLLEQYGLNLEKDVRSSVPRLTLSLNSKKWIDDSIDIYELLNNEFEPGAEFTEARREAINEFHMRVYFDKGSDKWLGRNIYAGIDKEGIDKTELDELIGRL